MGMSAHGAGDYPVLPRDSNDKGLLAALKPYSSYTPSTLEWLEALPKNWSCPRAKTIFSAVDIRSKTGDEELLTVSARSGVVPRRHANVTMFQAKSYVGHKLCWPNDLVVNSLWAWMQGLGVSRYHGLISSAYSVYRPRSAFADYARFFDHLLRSWAYKWELQTRSKGVWLSRLQLSDQAFMEMPILLPPAAEQRAIVRFLDYWTRKIDTAINAKQRLITLFNEQKRSIAYQLISCGVKPAAPRKDSGTPWLAAIPMHWKVLQLRRLVSLVTSGSRGWASHYSDDGYIFLQSGNLSRSMTLNLARIQYVTPPRGSEGERTRVQRDDILVCITGALTGNVAIVDVELPTAAYVNQHVALVRAKSRLITPRYLAMVLHSEIGRIQFKSKEYGGTKQGLGLDDVKSALVLFPPKEEQETICTTIDQETSSLSRTMLTTDREIALLREYRMRLIADVVTGKLDVRAAAAQLPDDEGEERDFAQTDEIAAIDEDEPAFAEAAND
jgi:type I restriction enzyme, S subunit